MLKKKLFLTKYFFDQYMDSFRTKEVEHIFLHPQVLIFIPFIISLFLSLFNLSFLSFSLGFLSYYLFSFYKANQLVKKFRCIVDHKLKGKEEEPFNISYKFRSIDYTTISDITFIDKFEGHIDHKRSTTLHHHLKSIPAKSIFNLNRKISLNNGMGKKLGGPFFIHGWDNSGLFEFLLENKSKRYVEVLPKVNPTKIPPEKESFNQQSYGLISNPSKGSNTNFYCTREYIPGDNTKHINWKLSLKANKTILNIFEKNTNSNITCVLIDDTRIHYGKGKYGSFENCKDLLLSFMHAQVNRNNEVAFISLQKNVKKSFTKDHLRHLEVLLANFEPIPIGKLTSLGRSSLFPEVRRLKFKILSQSSIEDEIYFFTSFLKGKVWESYEDLIFNLAAKGYQITLILVHGTKNEIESLKGERSITGLSPLIHTNEVIDDFTNRLKRAGIRIYKFNINDLKNIRKQTYELFKKSN